MWWEFTEEEIGLAMAMGGPLKPIHVPIERAAKHPLLKHAVIEDRRDVTWPDSTPRPVRVARDTVTPHVHTGSPYFLMPPRINADWWLPPNPTREDLCWIYGRVADLQRW